MLEYFNMIIKNKENNFIIDKVKQIFLFKIGIHVD